MEGKKWYRGSWGREHNAPGDVFLDGAPRGGGYGGRLRRVQGVGGNRGTERRKHHLNTGRMSVRWWRLLGRGKGGARWVRSVRRRTVFFCGEFGEGLGGRSRAALLVGMNSDATLPNWVYSFGMAFGGGGFFFSYPLAEAGFGIWIFVPKRDPPLMEGPYFASCVADLGVSLTQEKGFHSDISGFLSAHPQSPLVTLHHLDFVDPIFPTMDRYEGLNHLMKAAKADQSRLLQQSICYHRQKNWTFSVSWGYSVHLYEAILPQSLLRKPLQTFTPWSKSASPFFVFNTRIPSNNPCEAPHVFFFDSVENRDYSFITRYTQKKKRGLPACSLNGTHSATHVPEIRVVSPLWELDWVGSGRECCEVMSTDEKNATEIRISKGELFPKFSEFKFSLCSSLTGRCYLHAHASATQAELQVAYCRRAWLQHGLFLPRRSLGTNRATAAAPTMASPDLPFPGEAELSGGSASGPFRRLRQNRESFPPLVSTTQGSNDWVGIFGRFSKSMVVAAWTLRRRTVAASPSSVSCCSSSRLRLRLTEDEGSFMMD
nr:uncharacterized protein LOC109156312 [Ipomoea batatas]